VALLLAACAADSKEDFETTEKVVVSVEAARLGSIRDGIRVSGTVRPAAGAELLVTAPQPARIVEIPKTEGDMVRKGELLVRFEIPSLDAEIGTRESDLSRAEARLGTAGADAVRVEGLFDRGIASRKEVEDAHRELAEAQAAVSEARTALAAARQLLRREIVGAPFSGMIAGRWHNPGDLVEPSAGDPILRVIDPSRLQVEISVPVGDLPGIEVGNPAQVLGPGTYPPEEGRVLNGPSAVDPATGSAMVRVAFVKPTRLPSGTPVRVVVLGTEHRGVLLVPAGAIVHEGPSGFVFTVDGDGRARRRPVEVGITNGEDAEILSGLGAGEKVIVRGQEALPDGAAVTTTAGS
jgi:RND family efflux transporter MFP subunit